MSDGESPSPQSLQGLDEGFPEQGSPDPWEELSEGERLSERNRCYDHLVSQGLGPLELATMSLEESEAIARQVRRELKPTVPWGPYLIRCVSVWIEEAKAEADVRKRATCYLADDLRWMSLIPPTKLQRREEDQTPQPVLHPPHPPPGERNHYRVTDEAVATAREKRLLGIWLQRLQDELHKTNAPVILKIQGSLDPTRALDAIVGSTRSSTLKRYVSTYTQWRLWLAQTKKQMPPATAIDLGDYLFARADEPCRRTIPELIMKAVAWLEKVAEFPLEQRATGSRIAWAIKDTILVELSSEAPVTRRAPRYPVYLVLGLERVVMGSDNTVGWRVWAWAKLVKIWASLRWSDLQSILPAELNLVEGRLQTILRRTKTSGATKRVKQLQVCVSERSFLEQSGWIATGFNLLRSSAGYKRDYLLPKLTEDGGLGKKMASYADAMVATAWLCGGLWKFMATGQSTLKEQYCRQVSHCWTLLRRTETC